MKMVELGSTKHKYIFVCVTSLRKSSPARGLSVSNAIETHHSKLLMSITLCVDDPSDFTEIF
jgi:hypothetical protein